MKNSYIFGFFALLVFLVFDAANNGHKFINQADKCLEQAFIIRFMLDCTMFLVTLFFLWLYGRLLTIINLFTKKIDDL